MTFSIKNGLKITWHHLHDSSMVFSLLIAILPAAAIVERWGWKPAAIYIVSLMLLFILLRCWDDPIKSGKCSTCGVEDVEICELSGWCGECQKIYAKEQEED